MSRIIALDYGSKRTGIAVTDPLRIVPTGLDTIETKNLFPFLNEYFSKENVGIIVIGYPTHLDGNDTYLTKEIDEFLKIFVTKYPHIIVFKQSYELNEGQKKTNYYVSESVGLACGFLLQAIHQCGLVALTHTPSPMNFLSKLLKRPENEKPYLLIPIGYPADKVMVPDIKRKEKEQVIVYYQ